MIYLISSDSHRDSIDLEYYFTNEEQIESYIKKYYFESFRENVRNVKVDFENLKVTFEWLWGQYLDGTTEDDWEEETYYLFKLNQYE